MNSRHGSPFEHNAFTFFVEAPIFVFREWHRHRIASINEMSGRYTELLPKFYTPAPYRKLRNVGTSARPEMAEGTDDQLRAVWHGDFDVCQVAWKRYRQRLELGVANEIARTILPVSVYSQMYWTVNARSLMNFLSLRVDSNESAIRSRPQWEIQMGAEQVEKAFAEKMPITHKAFVNSGRIAP
jgi:thymidylate synthase (FAD)